MTAPRVVHVAVKASDIDRLLRSQLVAIAAAGYEVVAMSAPDDHVAALRAAGIEHLAIPALSTAASPAQDWRALRQMQRALTTVMPDIVHTHHPKPSVLGRLAARRAGVPVLVNTVDGLAAISSDDWVRKGLACGVERVASSWSDAELVQSAADLELLRGLGVPDSKLTLIGSGVDLTSLTPSAHSDGETETDGEPGPDSDSNTLTVGVVGQPGDDDAGRRLLDVASRRSDHNCRLVAIDLDDDSRRRCAGLDLVVIEPRTHRAVHAVADGVVKAVAMEAAAMGLAVVAEDTHDNRDIVADGRTGVLVAVEAPAASGSSDTDNHSDDPRVEALMAAVVGLAADPARRASMGAAAREHAVAHFDERCVVATTVRTYDWLRAGDSLRAGRGSALVAGSAQ